MYVVLAVYMTFYVIMFTFGLLYFFNECKSQILKENNNATCSITKNIFFTWNECHLEQVLPSFLIFSGCSGSMFIWMCICLLNIKRSPSSICKTILAVIAFLNYILGLSINLLGSRDLIFKQWHNWACSDGCKNDLFWLSFISVVLYWIHLPCYSLIFCYVQIQDTPAVIESLITHL